MKNNQIQVPVAVIYLPVTNNWENMGCSLVRVVELSPIVMGVERSTHSNYKQRYSQLAIVSQVGKFPSKFKYFTIQYILLKLTLLSTNYFSIQTNYKDHLYDRNY